MAKQDGTESKGKDADAAVQHFMILSSMKFVEKIVATREVLQGQGYQVSVPDDTDLMLTNPGLCDDLEADLQHCREQDELRKGFELVVGANAVLVLNHPKNGIDGYIGTSVLMELAISHYFRKYIFLLYPTPSFDEHRWAHEVAMMNTCCLFGDLSRLPCGVAVMQARENFDFSFEGSEAKFRELLLWAWRTLGREPYKVHTAADVSALSPTVCGLPNRERDRARILARGFAEYPDSAVPGGAKCCESGIKVTTGYLRVLFGDNGPYLECLHDQVCWEAFVYHKVKGPARHYHEHVTASRRLQIYEQFRGVGDEPNPPPGDWSCDNNRPEGYAPYEPGRIYVPADLVEPI
mmetsp:Transcript_162/g.244  ORF Transcript_162/g.244 Transcript_162/m.244 type:complete len:350 (+) Transcript_162:104-1153(+)